MEIKTLTVKSVTSVDKKKDGTPLVGKFGPYWMIRIDTLEEGVVSMFGKTASDLKMGDKIQGTVEVTTSEKDGKTYTNKNFKFPNKDDAQSERIAKLESRVMKLELAESRMYEDIYSKVKSDLVLELTGKFNTTADYKKITAPHPQFADVPEPIPAEAYNNEPPF